MTVQDALAALEQMDDAALLEAMRDLSEDERATAWAAASPSGRSNRWLFESSQPETQGRLYEARTLFFLGVGPVSVVQQARSAFSFLTAFGHLSADEIKEAVALRDAQWRTEMTAASLHTWAAEREVGLFGPHCWDWWQRIRSWARTDVLPVDTASAAYLVLMVRGLTFSGSIEDALLDDRALLEREVWLLFQPGEGVQRALLGADRYWDPSQTWRPSLVRLALGGALDADRLREEATRAAGDDTMARNHRAWYRRIPLMLDDPTSLPEPATTGPPPPGNQLSWSARQRR